MEFGAIAASINQALEDSFPLETGTGGGGHEGERGGRVWGLDNASPQARSCPHTHMAPSPPNTRRHTCRHTCRLRASWYPSACEPHGTLAPESLMVP